MRQTGDTRGMMHFLVLLMTGLRSLKTRKYAYNVGRKKLSTRRVQ
jgi:hypothetical protein